MRIRHKVNRPAGVAEKFADIRKRAAAHGRKVRLGVRLHVIVRETNDEAWADADRLISKLSDEDIAKAQNHARMDSVGQKRMAALHGGRRDKLEVVHLWAGAGPRGGAGIKQLVMPIMAARLQEYVDPARTRLCCLAIRILKNPFALPSWFSRCSARAA